jgi:DNA-binding PadR family transcriptional regulator
MLDQGAERFGRNAEPFILLLLLGGRSYGYEIRGKLEEFDFSQATRDPGIVYRLLRGFEAGGLIESEWDVSGSGPARRYYRLTEAGKERLEHLAMRLTRQAGRIGRFFETYETLGGQARE